MVHGQFLLSLRHRKHIMSTKGMGVFAGDFYAHVQRRFLTNYVITNKLPFRATLHNSTDEDTAGA